VIGTKYFLNLDFTPLLPITVTNTHTRVVLYFTFPFHMYM